MKKQLFLLLTIFLLFSKMVMSDDFVRRACSYDFDKKLWVRHDGIYCDEDEICREGHCVPKVKIIPIMIVILISTLLGVIVLLLKLKVWVKILLLTLILITSYLISIIFFFENYNLFLIGGNVG